MTAAQLVECFAEELQAEDKKLLRECSHIHLTMDGRKNNLVVRIRMALKQLPKGMCRDDAALQDGARPVRNITGKNFVRADRLLVFRRIKGNHTTADLAVLLADALRQACGTDEDLWESVRRKVVAFTPDGAHDEQLAGRSALAEAGAPSKEMLRSRPRFLEAVPPTPKPEKLVDRVPISSDGQWVMLKKEETWWNNSSGKIHVNSYETTYVGPAGGQWALRDWKERWQQVKPPPSASK